MHLRFTQRKTISVVLTYTNGCNMYTLEVISQKTIQDLARQISCDPINRIISRFIFIVEIVLKVEEKKTISNKICKITQIFRRNLHLIYKGMCNSCRLEEFFHEFIGGYLISSAVTETEINSFKSIRSVNKKKKNKIPCNIPAEHLQINLKIHF